MSSFVVVLLLGRCNEVNSVTGCERIFDIISHIFFKSTTHLVK